MLRRIGIVCLAALASLTAAISAWAIGPEKPGWHPPELVLGGGAGNPALHQGADRILAYDHYGRPGVAVGCLSYTYYARRVPGYGWGGGYAVVVSSLFARSPSLAFDRHELPVVGCGGEEVYIARLDADNVWHDDKVYNEPSYSCSVAVDLYGRMAMAWHDPDPTIRKVLLAYDRNDDGAFDEFGEIQTVNWPLTGQYVSLAFDGDNRPMLAYQDADSEDLMFAVQGAGTVWLNICVDGAGSQGWKPSLAVNPMTGYPAIAYAGDGGGSLRYAEWDGHEWQITTLPNPRDNGILGVSLAFDPADGNPAIAYHEGDPLSGDPAPDWNFGLLAFTWRHDETWENQVVAWEGDTGLHPSVAFNDYGPGWAGIAYLDSLGNVWYVEDPPVVPEPATLALLAAGVAAVAAGRRRGDRRRS